MHPNIPPPTAGAHLLIQLYGRRQRRLYRTSLARAWSAQGPDGVLDTSRAGPLYSDKCRAGCRRRVDPAYTPRATRRSEEFLAYGVDISSSIPSRMLGRSGGVWEMADQAERTARRL